jgi:hypothetical protein
MTTGILSATAFIRESGFSESRLRSETRLVVDRRRKVHVALCVQFAKAAWRTSPISLVTFKAVRLLMLDQWLTEKLDHFDDAADRDVGS